MATMTLIRNSRNTRSTNGLEGLDGFQELRTADFRKMSALLYEKSGILLQPVKMNLLEARIRKRLRALGLPSFQAYSDFLFTQEGQDQELENFINVLTTNKTDFMREFAHFEFLTEEVLPRLLRKRKRLSFWSAACSKGAEPYTLAMVLEEYLRMNPQCGLCYQILATDISTKVLNEAVQAVYDEDDIEPIPMDWRKRYILRGRSNYRGQVRMAPVLRDKIQFRHLNLMEAFDNRSQHDVIFCRNVTIYFDRETQNRLVRKFLNIMQPDGYLIMGHSESLDIQANPIKACAPSVYQRI